MNQNHMEQRILEAIGRHAEELTEAEVVIDKAFFQDLKTALDEAYLADDLEGLDLKLIHRTLNQLQVDWSYAEQHPENRGPLPAAV